MALVKVVLKDKEGKVVRSLEYPEKNAVNLINRNSGWVLPDDSPYTLKDGELTKKTPKAAKPDNSETSKTEKAS